MRIDNGVIARGEDGFAGENRRGESLIRERTVDDWVGDPYAGDVDGAGAEKFFEEGANDETSALADMKQYELKTEDCNIFNHRDTARILNRRV